jgi:cephalosporin hydroxylase
MRRFLGRLRARVKAYLKPEPYRIRPGQHKVPSDVTPLTADEQAIVDAFHKLYYDQRVQNRETVLLSWFGHRIEKCPFDIWTYQEIIFDTKPDLIVECGTRFGGGALYLASLLDLRGGPGEIVTIDITPMRHQPKHPRITYVVGSSSDPDVFARVKAGAAGKRTMVILDSDHSAAQVAGELKIYPEFVTPGCYLIVDDTDLGGHPVLPEHGPGPTEALDEWYPTQSDFVIDPSRERFMLSLNPRGYLKRVR